MSEVNADNLSGDTFTVRPVRGGDGKFAVVNDRTKERQVWQVNGRPERLTRDRVRADAIADALNAYNQA